MMTTIDKDEVLRIEGLVKGYPSGFWRKRAEVLTDFDLVIRRGETVGFLGPNGAGKTTTLKIINGLVFQDRGTVRFFGGTEAGANVRSRIGFLPEQPYFYESLTGDEFLRFCGRLHGMRRGVVAERSREMLASVGLSEAADRPIRKYSKGMMQRLGLAQALLHDPEFVILDEPMSGLDPVGRMEVRDRIRTLRDAGKTVFFSTHIVHDVEVLCDRVVMLDRGRKVAEGTVEELVGGEVLRVEMSLEVPEGTRIPDRFAPCRRQDRVLFVDAKTVDEARGMVAHLAEAGLYLLSMTPVRRSLEDLYWRREGDSGKGGENV